MRSDLTLRCVSSGINCSYRRARTGVNYAELAKRFRMWFEACVRAGISTQQSFIPPARHSSRARQHRSTALHAADAARHTRAVRTRICQKRTLHAG
jgi:hypothetical protein